MDCYENSCGFSRNDEAGRFHAPITIITRATPESSHAPFTVIARATPEAIHIKNNPCEAQPNLAPLRGA